jgi:hypothetical protein
MLRLGQLSSAMRVAARKWYVCRLYLLVLCRDHLATAALCASAQADSALQGNQAAPLSKCGMLAAACYQSYAGKRLYDTVLAGCRSEVAGHINMTRPLGAAWSMAGSDGGGIAQVLSGRKHGPFLTPAAPSWT